MTAKKSIYSMTGFGRSSVNLNAANIVIECKSLNSRHLEVILKIPRVYNSLELELRQLIQSQLSRGRVEVFISRKLETITQEEQSEKQTVITSELKKKLLENERQYNNLGISLDDNQRFEVARLLLSQNTLSHEEEVVGDAESAELKKNLEVSIKQLLQQRSEEGQRLLSDLFIRLQSLFNSTAELKIMAAEIPKLIRERVSERIRANLASIVVVDEARLLQEVTILVEKADVTEELVRLDSHLKLFEDTLKAGGLVGKRLDFICQELFREFNTLGGKSASAEIQAVVVDCKVELERIREQVQNLE